MIGHARDGEPIKTRGRRKRHLDSDETTLTNMSEEQTSDPEDSLRMVLIGKTGVGKSAVGNTILMEKLFPSSVHAASVTTVCKRGTGKVQGRKLEVIDTPGLFDINLSQEKVTAEIAKWFAYAAPGPHVFLIILKADRFTKEEEETVKILQELFGEQAAHYTMTLFTYGDDLEADGVAIENVIRENKDLSDFLDQCKGGYHVFNNRNEDPAQVHELLEKINTMVERNGGSYYTNEMFQEAEKAVEEKMNELLMAEPQRDRDDARTEAKEYVAGNGDVSLVLIGAKVGGGIGVLVGVIGVAAGPIGAGVDAAFGAPFRNVIGAAVGSLLGGPIGAAVGAAVGAVAEVVMKKACVIQ